MGSEILLQENSSLGSVWSMDLSSQFHALLFHTKHVRHGTLPRTSISVHVFVRVRKIHQNQFTSSKSNVNYSLEYNKLLSS